MEITKLNATIIKKEAELKKEADMGVSAVKQAALQCTIKELYNQKQELENSLKQKEFAASVREQNGDIPDPPAPSKRAIVKPQSKEPTTAPPSQPAGGEPHSVKPPTSDNPYSFNPGVSEHVKYTDETYGSSDIDNAKPDAKALALKKEVREICDDFYRAVDGLGTDDKLFEKTLSRLNADNIIEVMSNWEQTYGEDYKEHFIDSFLGDADPSQKKEFGLKIVQALEERMDKLSKDEHYTKTATKAKISLNKSMLNPLANQQASFYINTLYNILKIKER